MTRSTHATLRLSGSTDLAAAVPHLLGFHPAESLVALALRGPRLRVTFSCRLDLAPEEYDEKLAAAAAGHLRKASADAALLVVYTEAPSAAAARRALVDAVAAALAPDVPVQDALLVTGGRVRSYLCDDTGCCPAEGRPVEAATPAATSLAAAFALEGRAVLPDRASVVALVEPTAAVASPELGAAVREATAAWWRQPPGRRIAEGRLVLLAALARAREERPQWSDAELARFAVVLSEGAVRDEAMMLVGQREDEAFGMLLEFVRRLPLGLVDAHVCTLLGWLAYLRGDGVLASAAFERALRSDGRCAMPRMLLQLLQAQVSPSEVRALVRVPSRRERRARRAG